MEPSEFRAYTDQLTGSLKLLDLPSNTLFKYAIKARLPEIFRSSFLHEATHFWCEATDLGAALACLEMRAQRELLLETLDESRFVHDVGVVDATRLLLTPLLEGMALFQEFDTFPGMSRVWADPGLWAGMLFTPLDEDMPNGVSQQEAAKWISHRIYDVLADYRGSAAAVRRKTEILMQPLSGDPHYYLSGYLAVKQIWFLARRNTNAFEDRDLFLSFLRSWVFQDWRLIDEALDLNWNPTLAVTLVSKRLQERLRELATTDLTTEALLYERTLNSTELDQSALINAMRLSTLDARAGSDSLRDMVSHLYEGLRQGGESENVYFSDVVTLNHRQELMRLALEKVQIEVNSFQRVLVRRGPDIDDVYLAGPAPEGAEPGITTGWIAVYYLPRLRKMLTIAVRSDQPMIWFPGQLGIPDEEFNLIRSTITKVIATEDARHELHVTCREIARSFSDKDYMDLVAKVPSHVSQAYAAFALSFVEEEHDSAVREMLGKKGVYTLLGRDGDLLTGLAAISLLPGEARQDAMNHILGGIGLDANWVRNQLEEAMNRTGAQIVLETLAGDICCRI